MASDLKPRGGKRRQPPLSPMPPFTRLATTAASNGLLTGQILFSLARVCGFGNAEEGLIV
jgi:hypothetical protein